MNKKIWEFLFESLKVANYANRNRDLINVQILTLLVSINSEINNSQI
jgi:hypothetical protein